MVSKSTGAWVAFSICIPAMLFPQCGGCGVASAERIRPFIWRIVVLNKITDINFCLPVRPFKTLPRFGIQHIAGIDIYLHEK